MADRHMKFITLLSERKRVQDQGKFSPAQTGDSFPVTGLERWSLPFFNVRAVLTTHKSQYL